MSASPTNKKRKVEGETDTENSTEEIEAKEEKKLVLYTYWRSSCSWRVRLVLGLKSIPYESSAVNLLTAQHKSESYTKLNPMNELPYLVLADGTGRGIAQSMAICEYLEETYTQVPLLPKDPYLRAKCRQLCEIITSDTQPVQNMRVLNRVQTIANADERAKWGVWVIEMGFKALEQEVSKIGGKYCMGDDVTLADVCLVPQMYNARRFNVDLTAYPHLVAIDARLSELAAFKAAHADAQPDAVKA